TQFIKALGIAFRTIHGRNLLDRAQKVDWATRLGDLEDPAKNAPKRQEDLKHNESWRFKVHVENLQRLAGADEKYPKPSEIFNAVIIAAYNEDIAVIEPTVKAVIESDYDMKKTILIFAYEGRDGAQSEEACLELVEKYGNKFKYAHAVKHPLTEGEVRGKGGNITYAGKYLEKWLKEQSIDSNNVIVTTLDSDNRPHKTYFSYVTYEYIVHPDRLRVAFQPISLFLNNIWDAPAPMRVVATGNSFWNIISSTRPYSLRNFASHSQVMKALEMMNFWSVRTIVEDGHQYWRSYFFFNGRYSVIPIYVPIYQDAVLTESYKKTLKAQFIQLRRWAYGASDIAYVATNIFTRDRKVPFFPALARLIRLIDGHVSLAAMPLIIAFG
ncbi:glycosyltransferase, partial [Candidatus Saccharibacteria bacterium]|nr:glycosyltransferase [Candidatus Saccharibacteria bacterium]